MERPVFALGLGTQRAGSTTLFRMLQMHPEISMTPVKELHIFDWRYGSVKPHDREPPFQQYVGCHSPDVAFVEAFLPRWRRMLDDDQEYVAYFRELLAASPGIKVVGEITPDYVAIPAERHAAVRRLLESAGFRPVPIVVLRDPVDRIWSHFHFRRFHETPDGILGEGELVRAVIDNAASRHRRDRTAYDEILARLEHAYDRSEYFVAFFEEMFGDGELQRLFDMLGVTSELSWQPSHEHKTDYPHEIPAAVVDEVRRMYAPTYAAMAERFGKERIKRVWRHA